MMNSHKLLEIDSLSVSFRTRAGDIPAVSDFSLVIERGESMGLVGESGCGKSTVALAVMRYLGANGRITGGRILYNGQDICSLDLRLLRKLRGSKIAMVYQEPMASLNPAMSVGNQLVEVLETHENEKH